MKLSGTHSASLNGPLPIAVSFLERSAFASPIFFETIPVLGWAMYAISAAFGFFRSNTTVESSGAVIVLTSVKNDLATAAVLGSMIRSKVYFTSALVSGSPLSSAAHYASHALPRFWGDYDRASVIRDGGVMPLTSADADRLVRGPPTALRRHRGSRTCRGCRPAVRAVSRRARCAPWWPCPPAMWGQRSPGRAFARARASALRGTRDTRPATIRGSATRVRRSTSREAHGAAGPRTPRSGSLRRRAGPGSRRTSVQAHRARRLP